MISSQAFILNQGKVLEAQRKASGRGSLDKVLELSWQSILDRERDRKFGIRM